MAGKTELVATYNRALNLWWIIGYFGLLATWRLLTVIDYMPLWTAISVIIPFLFIAALAGLLLCIVGYVQAKATLYTITNKRVVMRIGAALTITLNLPFTKIDNAAVAKKRGGLGNIAFETSGSTKFSYFVLWPHARSWHFGKPQPTLRCIPEIEKVSSILGEAAKSRIEDADFAKETSQMTKSQILSQAATSMLAQANASKQNLLALLQG